MTTDLVDWIENRIDADPGLDDDVGLNVLAALAGDAELDNFLDTGSPKNRQPADLAGEQHNAVGAFLRSIRVTGFRGIGREVKLELDPAPGLTVVAGRNGSGKSSIAEALEVLLTGGTYRWKSKKSTQWSERWRNLHHPGPVEVVAEVLEEGSGLTTISTRWAAGVTDVNDQTTRAQRTVKGTKGPEQDASVLGWARPMETFRPMLSYDELGGMLEAGPSELYDALAKVLGMEQLADALKRIQARLKVLKEPGTTVTGERRHLAEQAALLDDERAVAVVPLLKKTAPDTRAIRKLATGVTRPDHGIVASLRALANLEAPESSIVTAAIRRLRDAVSGMAAAGEAEAARRVARLDLRRSALHLHDQFGEQSCPVCNSTTLDESWAQASRDLIWHEESQLAELADAQAELHAARNVIRAHVSGRPAPLDRAPADDLESAVAAARDAWDAYAAVPDPDLDVADHLELHLDDLTAAVAELRVAATSALSERDDAWGPMAVRISAWCQAWDGWLKAKPHVDRLAAAEKWLKDNDTTLKNERIAPISEQARHIWSILRQESNVELGNLRLEGQATRRRVAISATIDGTDAGGALPVMSQGELHALALALFLPRASLTESPFRFVILDDPVQAMDPAKVDGLAALLSELAETRQVIVFSHDDRLPSALRRSNVGARIFEVTRGKGSMVTITNAEDPTTRYLADASALIRDEKVPAETLRRTIPGLIRMAIESAARDRFFAQRLTRGDALADVEDVWNAAHSSGQKVSLAIYDEVKSLDGWLRTESRKVALGSASSAFHHGLYEHVDPDDAVYHTRRMINDVQTGAR